MRYSFFWIYFYNLPHLVYIIKYVYSTLCFGNSSATLSCYRTLHPSLNFRSHVRNSFFFWSLPSSLFLNRRVRFFFLVDNLIKRESVHRDFFRINCTILRAPTIRPRIIASCATEMTMTVVESRY